MTYEEEIAELKVEYKKKMDEFEKNKNPRLYRDCNGRKEYDIELWFSHEITRLQEKYNITTY